MAIDRGLYLPHRRRVLDVVRHLGALETEAHVIREGWVSAQAHEMSFVQVDQYRCAVRVGRTGWRRKVVHTKGRGYKPPLLDLEPIRAREAPCGATGFLDSGPCAEYRPCIRGTGPDPGRFGGGAGARQTLTCSTGIS